MKIEDLQKTELTEILKQLAECEEDAKFDTSIKVRTEIAKKLKERNYDDELISKVTDLDISEIEDIGVSKIKRLLYEYLERLPEGEINNTTK